MTRSSRVDARRRRAVQREGRARFGTRTERRVDHDDVPSLDAGGQHVEKRQGVSVYVVEDGRVDHHPHRATLTLCRSVKSSSDTAPISSKAALGHASSSRLSASSVTRRRRLTPVSRSSAAQ